jgi:hypothetical protein
MTHGLSVRQLRRLADRALFAFEVWYVVQVCIKDHVFEFPLPYLASGHPLTSSSNNASYLSIIRLFLCVKLDCLVKFDDGTFGVIDFKTSNVSRSSHLYGRQLHAYATAIESPASGSELVPGIVSDLGLVIYEPSAFSALSPTGAALTGALQYVNIPRDQDRFVSFLGDVVDLLALDDPPPPPPPQKKSWASVVTACPYCQFLHDAQKRSMMPDIHT